MRILTSMPTETSMSINSSLKHGQTLGNEMRNLCTPTENAVVAEPNSWVDFCNPCKRLKHSVQHKKCFSSRVKFYCYCLSPYGDSTEHEAKTASCFCESWFSLPDFGTQYFVQSWECPHQFLEWRWFSVHNLPYNQASALPKLVAFSGVASADSEVTSFQLGSQVAVRSMGVEPALARTSSGTTRFIFVGESTESL